MKVLAFFARRLAWAFAIVFAVTTLTFFLARALPSDPARMVAGPQARPADVARIRVQLGLDRPIAAQYVSFLRRIVHVGPTHFEAKTTPDHATCGHLGPLHLDLGRSYQQRRPVVEVLASRLPFTIALAFLSIFFAISIGIGAGTIAALKRNTWIDAGAVSIALLGVSAPTFLLGVAIQYVFAYRLALFPLNGGGADTLVDHARHIFLPALTLGVFYGAFQTRIVRGELVELLDADHVRTARAKGLSRWRVVTRHALRNAMVPIVTIVGLDLGALLGGAVITEQVFSWPGIGTLAVRAMLDHDGPMIVGTVIVAATAIVLATIAVDFLYALLDPRIRT